MAAWLVAFRFTVLDELLRKDGLGGSMTPGTCVNCTELPGKYRCSDCFGSYMYCSKCIVSSHRNLPLHRLQVRPSELSVSGQHHRYIILGLGGRLF
jgi:hypothetical protein